MCQQTQCENKDHLQTCQHKLETKSYDVQEDATTALLDRNT